MLTYCHVHKPSCQAPLATELQSALDKAVVLGQVADEYLRTSGYENAPLSRRWFGTPTVDHHGLDIVNSIVRVRHLAV